MQRHFTRTAIAAGILSSFAVHAPAADLPTVVVTATRFEETTLRTPGNITVISAEDIRNLPATNLPDVLKSVAGVNVRPLYGSLGIDAAVDVRGFGDTAQSNTLILVDGQRVNPIDAAGPSWSAIPLENIRRIEVMRGAGAVLYGDQASGGVINIITDKSAQPHASLTATAGSFGYRGLAAEGAVGNADGYANIFVHDIDSDGWRRNSKMEQQAVSGRAGLLNPGGEIFVDYAWYKDRSGLPSSLLSKAYQDDPRSTRTPFDKQQRDGYRVRPGVSYALSGTLTLEAELAVDNETYKADNVSFSSTTHRTRDMTSFTPRLRWNHGLGGLDGVTVVGVDYYDGEVKTRFDGASFLTTEKQGGQQQSTALYAQTTGELGAGWSISAGARSQRMDQTVTQNQFMWSFGFPSPALRGEAIRTRNAYDLGLVYQTSGWRAYGKIGSMFRFANTDELFGFDPFTGNPVFAGNIKPQHGTIAEVGGGFAQGPLHAGVSLYRQNLHDEIGYDGTLFANVNLDPTRRQGLEAEADLRLTDALDARLSYTYIDATFREGAYAGKELPLVPKDKATGQLTWKAGRAGTYTALVTYVGDRRYSGDFANALGKLSGYTTLDLQASWDLKPWTVTAKLINATDRRYAPFAGYSTFRADYYYFPADARSAFVSARYDF